MKYCNQAEEITFEVKLNVARKKAIVCFRNFFASGVDLDFGEAAWRPLECSVQSTDELILQSVWDDIIGVWSLMLVSSAKQSVDTASKELFEEASSYLDVLDYSRVNKKLIRE